MKYSSTEDGAHIVVHEPGDQCWVLSVDQGSTWREGKMMSEITTIVHFGVPEVHRGEFIPVWAKTQEVMLSQPGAIDGVLHRCIDSDSPFQFVNVARWESADALRAALTVAAEVRMAEGVNVGRVLRDWGVTVSQNNYSEEVRY